MEVIIDTNFLLTCAKQKIDLFEQIGEIIPNAKIIIPERVLEELSRLVKSKKLKVKEREAANLALQIIKKEKLKIIKLEGHVDDAIVTYALNKKGVIVASLDRGIKGQLKNKARMLTIRQKKRIVFA